jgi:inosine-uridine nucleoside N-ribohydrolase
MIKVHLDTDLGGDIDDLCALALLLRRKDVQITGVTTVCDNLGQRAGYTRYVLDLEGRRDIPVAVGAEAEGGYFRQVYGLPAHEAYWSEPAPALPGPLDDALALIKNSLDQGAILVGIGPYTNLRLFGEKYPGCLERARLFLMGGYLYPVRTGFPQWGNQMDFNVQADVRSAHYALEHAGSVTLIPLTVTVETALRRAYLPALRQAGSLGSLIAAQAEAFATEYQYETLFGGTCPGLPRDLINFQHDPLACAIALGWDREVEFEEAPLVVEEQDGWLVERFAAHAPGAPVRVVTKINAEAFNRYWLELITLT